MMSKDGRENKKSNFPYWYASILILVLAFSIFLFYRENNKGTLQINTIGENINIFIDNEDRGLFDITKESKIIKISQGKHSIILSKENYWPWTTELDIKRKQILEIKPFFVPQNTSGFIIPETDPEYYDILSLFNTKTHIDWEKNKNTPEIILNFEEEIRSSDFYKNRDDVIIVAVLNGVFALEINSDSTPNFQPIYKGQQPTFVKKDDKILYIKDINLLMEVAY